TLIVVDEAHHLAPDMLEELRLLSNLEGKDGRAVQILLVGLLEIEQTLDKPGLLALRQRLTTKARLEPLNADESAEYLSPQVTSAGGEPSRLFGEDVLDILTHAANGVPRILNQVAHAAFSLAAEAETDQVDSEAAVEAVTRLGLDPAAGAEPLATDEEDPVRLVATRPVSLARPEAGANPEPPSTHPVPPRLPPVRHPPPAGPARPRRHPWTGTGGRTSRNGSARTGRGRSCGPDRPTAWANETSCGAKGVVMGRTFEVLAGRLRQAAGAVPVPAVAAPPPETDAPAGPELVPISPDDLPADDDSVPHVEVGGPRAKTTPPAGPQLRMPRLPTGPTVADVGFQLWPVEAMATAPGPVRADLIAYHRPEHPVA